MDHIKLFENFNQVDDIIQDLNDMLLDSKDVGFNIITLFDSDQEKITISIKKPPKFFLEGEIKDFILRSYQYMRELGYFSAIYCNGNSNAIVIRPDEIIKVKSRSNGIYGEEWLTIDENYPYVLDMLMIFSKTPIDQKYTYKK